MSRMPAVNSCNDTNNDSFISWNGLTSCYDFLCEKIQKISKDIFSKVTSLFESPVKEMDLEKCIQALKMIPSLSQKERMNWNSWCWLHTTSLTAFNFRIPGLSSNFVVPLPWHPLQIRSHSILTDDGLRTACGVTHRIALTKILGPDGAADLLNRASKQVCDLDSALNNPKPLLLSLETMPCNLVVKGEPVTGYGGHVWTVFKASPDRYLMITSYLRKQNAAVLELNGEEMRGHIRDIRMISDADEWTEKVDAAYKKWFGVSHEELIDWDHSQSGIKKPWRVTFKSVQPNICNVDRIQEQFLQVLGEPYFPRETILQKGDKLPIGDAKNQEEFDRKNSWWATTYEVISLRKAIADTLL